MRPALAFLLLISTGFAGHTVGIRADARDQSGLPFMGMGSAVVLDKTDKGYWVAVTARHVVRGADKVYVGLKGQWHEVANVYPSPDANQDAAFVTFQYDGDLNRTDVAEEDVGPGESITWSGFSSGAKYEKMEGRTTDIGFASCRIPPRQGQSGGGVYDRRGRLIGIVVGYDSAGNLVYEPIGRVRRSCRRHWGFFWGISIGVPPPVHRPPPYVPQPAPSQPAPSRPNVIPRPMSPPPAVDEMPVAPPPPVEVEPPAPVQPLPPAEQPPKPVETPPKPVEQPAASCQCDKNHKSCKCEKDCKCDPKAACKCDPNAIAELKAEIAAIKAIKIPVQILRQDGTIFDSAEYKLGNPIKLKLAPVEKK